MIHKATVSYCGKEYHGFAVQKGRPTIQSELNKALQTVTRQLVPTKVAARTDKGVHALANVISFEVGEKLDLYRFKWAVNAVLPSNIKINSIE